GYVAASVRRGIGFVQAPTSLLAQVDSSVGGKTGINSAHGKNLIGAFYQPGLVLADTDTLTTLSPRELRAGYAEVVKYGLIDDPVFFTWLEQNYEALLEGADPAARTHAIAMSCRAKARIVSEDEQEHGKRALLNLGHTFGHALEGATGYSERLVHGEGVAIGMVMAHDFSAHMNLCSRDDGARVRAHLQAVGLPTQVSDIPGEPLNAEMLLEFIAQDKKVQRGALTFILTKGIGEAFVSNDVPPSAVQDFLEQSLM
ncbi:MAG: 3-dehydroquinate synthase, partial [Hyphomicrobiales bacterium]